MIILLFLTKNVIISLFDPMSVYLWTSSFYLYFFYYWMISRSSYFGFGVNAESIRLDLKFTMWAVDSWFSWDLISPLGKVKCRVAEWTSWQTFSYLVAETRLTLSELAGWHVHIMSDKPSYAPFHNLLCGLGWKVDGTALGVCISSGRIGPNG